METDTYTTAGESSDLELNLRLVDAGDVATGYATDTSDNCGSGDTTSDACSGGSASSNNTHGRALLFPGAGPTTFSSTTGGWPCIGRPMPH